MIKILHSSDLSLGGKLPFSPAVGERMAAAQLATLDRLLAHATAHEVDLLIFTGNLFAHHAPEVSLREAVAHRLTALAPTIRIVILPGCYDHPLGGDSVYRDERFHPWVVEERSVDSQPLVFNLTAGDLFLYTLPWQCDPGNAQSYMARRCGDGVHLGAFHSLKLDQRNPFQDPLVHWKKAILAWDLDYVVVGNRSHGTVEHGGTLRADCPGTPQGLSFNECGERCCSVVTLGADGAALESPATESIRFEQRELAVMTHEPAEHFHQMLDEWAQRDVALRVRLVGAIEELFDPVKVVARHQERFALLACDDETRFLASETLTRLAEEETVRGILCRRFIELAVEASESQRSVYEQALRELLHRFHAVAEDEV
ncbi:metallophosphoesterase [uncultured Desulfuromonas sp.]|uniref:metallophosphoesterase family protein n=1 Tax=uncultured Desulfuromonas sp. TaxID=181013 RepID=UPI002AAB1BAA|nr:metallophosphoesterase [uncultured Desulfuromonas sp.]